MGAAQRSMPHVEVLRKPFSLGIRRSGFTLLEMIRAHRDRRRLALRVPSLRNLDTKLSRERHELLGSYETYIREVSRRDMAISLQLAAFLGVACEELQPSAILDLGSGYSSYVLRRYASSAFGAAVHSVDDSEHWLERTRSFLSSQGLPPEHLEVWSIFSRKPVSGFDFILHDLGDMETRVASIDKVIKMLAPNGILLLDDMHKQVYAAYARRLLASHSFEVLSLERFTRDRIGRYAALAIPPSLGDEPRGGRTC